MIDPREKMAGQRNLLERFLLRIPGFKGYLEKEYRREGDHLVRQHLSARLGECKRALAEVMRGATEGGRIALLQPLGQTSALLEKVEGRIRFARHGYSAFFEATKVRNEELDQVYEFDLALMDSVEDLSVMIESLGGALSEPAEFRRQADDLNASLRRLDTELGGRDRILDGLAEGH